VVLDAAEARHVTAALRLGVGDEVVLADGRGTTASAVLRTASRARVEAEVVEIWVDAPPAHGEVAIALGLLDARAMDWAVQKCVEVGATRLIPLLTERSQAGRRETSGRSDHWRRISLQAIKQCRRPWAMEIAAVVSPAELVERTRAECGVVADRAGVGAAALKPTPERVLAVGPEGGFSSAEEGLFAEACWPKLSLGPHVLRAETAAVVGAAVLVGREAGGHPAGV
jgi:16S rRNA (uracil1498-N3)-methyltransferase